jgi:CheY-like chemotaxis protein
MPLILCVDDNPSQLVLLRFLLERAGFEVSLAANGQEAIDLTPTLKPDLILMDMMMPVKDGYQASVEIKADPDLAQIPIVLLTAYNQRDVEQRAAAAGIDAVLSKTILPMDLLIRVQDLLQAHKTDSATQPSFPMKKATCLPN